MRDRRLRRLFLRFRQRGDYDALTRVFDETAPALVGLAVHVARPPHAPEDLVQATFLTAIERAGAWDEDRPLYPWLAGILVHKARSWNEREARHLDPRRLAERPGEPDPAQVAGGVELGTSLRRALAELPDLYRGVLEPWFERGVGPGQIARELGLAPGTVRVRLHRGLERLRRVLPPGLALGAGLAGLRTGGLAAVREAVTEAARTGGAVLATGSAGGGSIALSSPATAPVFGLCLALAVGASAYVATHDPAEVSSAPVPGATPATVPDSPPPAQRPPVQPSSQPHSEPPRRDVPPPDASAPTLDAPSLTWIEPMGTPVMEVAPSTVLLRGGRTTIGSTVAEIEELVQGEAGAKSLLRALDGETPQHTRDVSPFRLGVTEVTHQQYGAFLQATGHRLPDDWAKGGDLEPVTRVSYADAEAYCRWAGMRLPTEFEYQHAVRGATTRAYPWGDDWQDGRYAATSELTRSSGSHPVASFEEGRSGEGLYDLAGNVWEWTASPYSAYPDYSANEYKLPGEPGGYAAPTLRWEPAKRVVVGGSFQNSKLAARCTVRRGSDRNQETSALGFRVAATPLRGFDIASAAEVLVNASPSLPKGMLFNAGRVLALDRWWLLPEPADAPEGYRVIGGYEHVAFVPRAELREVSDVPFREGSVAKPVILGFLTLSVRSLEPALDPGVYLVAFRAAGRSDGQAPWTSTLDTEVDNILLLDSRTGDLVGHQPVEGVAFGKTEENAGFTSVYKRKLVDDPADNGTGVENTERWLGIQCEVTTRLRRHVLAFPLDLRLEAECWDW